MPKHLPAPGEQIVQLRFPVVLPGVEDEHDGCVQHLAKRLRAQTGIREVHVDRDEQQQLVLCLHYDPNLVPLAKLERLAKEEGAGVTDQYRHEVLPVKGMGQGTVVAHIEEPIRAIPGVISAALNYASETLHVEYDSYVTNRETIIQTLVRLGYRVPVATPSGHGHNHHDHDHQAHDHHGHDHHDHHGHDDHEHCDHDHEAHDHDHSHDEKEHAEHPHAGHDHHAHDHHDHGNCDHDHEEHGHDHHGHHHGHGHHGHHHGHSHGPVDPNANWFQRNPELSMSLLSGVLLSIAFVTTEVLKLPAVGIAIYVASYLAGGYDLARHTVPTVIRGRFDVEFLMLVAAAGAAALGEWMEGALLLFLFSFGHALEHFAMERARAAIEALGSIVPKTARIRRDGTEIEVPVKQLRVGDIAIVRPGDRLAVDGKIIQGNSAIDQSPITGESVPVEKVEGDGVFAGSINGDGALEVEVTKLARDTTMARVIAMVEEAQGQKSPTQTFTDRFEKVFVPCVLGGVVLAAVLPPLFGWLPWKEAILRALSALVAASPCALALATPSAVLAGIGQAARNGVLIKGGLHLENLGSLRAIALDKTGTITRGKPEVTDVLTAPGQNETELLRLVGAVETRSSHPLAQAVVRRVQSLNLDLPPAGELRNLQGRGVESEVDGQTIRVGNFRMFDEAGIAVPPELAQQVQNLSQNGKPIMIVGRDKTVLGALGLADEIRPETKTALEKLRAMGVSNLIMLTGDNARVAQSIAGTAGVTDFRADLLPEDKVKALKELLSQHGQVAMIGDGVNDAPALATATVGIAMGAGGTDVALETADVALMSDDLSKLPYAVGLSRASRNIIQQNLWIALGVIALLLPSTLSGYAGISLAVIFHEGSTLVVVFNALRLLAYKPAD